MTRGWLRRGGANPTTERSSSRGKASFEESIAASLFGLSASRSDWSSGSSPGGAGLTVAEACLMSMAVNAGSSQLVALSMWATPLPLVAIVATTLPVNLRHVLMGLTLQPSCARLSAPRAYGTFFFLTDGSWALATVETERRRPDGAFMLGVGLVMYACWVGASATGRITGARPCMNPCSPRSQGWPW